MNNYFIVSGIIAFTVFGCAALFIGGVCTGAAIPAFYSSTRKRRRLIVAFIGAIVGTGLGFNTLDFLLGNFYWINCTSRMIPIDLMITTVQVESWNYYFFLFVVPTWISGFLLGYPLSAKIFKMPKKLW